MSLGGTVRYDRRVAGLALSFGSFLARRLGRVGFRLYLSVDGWGGWWFDDSACDVAAVPARCRGKARRFGIGGTGRYERKQTYCYGGSSCSVGAFMPMVMVMVMDMDIDRRVSAAVPSHACSHVCMYRLRTAIRAARREPLRERAIRAMGDERRAASGDDYTAFLRY